MKPDSRQQPQSTASAGLHMDKGFSVLWLPVEPDPRIHHTGPRGGIYNFSVNEDSDKPVTTSMGEKPKS